MAAKSLDDLNCYLASGDASLGGELEGFVWNPNGKRGRDAPHPLPGDIKKANININTLAKGGKLKVALASGVVVDVGAIAYRDVTRDEEGNILRVKWVKYQYTTRTWAPPKKAFKMVK